MTSSASVPFYRKRVFGVLVIVCLVLAGVIPWATVSAIALVNGPSVVLAGTGYDAVAVSPDGRTLYAADSGHAVTPVDIATGKVGRPISGGAGPGQLAVAPDGRMLLEVLSSGLIARVDLATGKETAPIRVPGGACMMAVSPDGRTLYVATNANAVVAVDIASGRERPPIPLPTPSDGAVGPQAMAVTPNGKTVYVADGGDEVVVPVDVAVGRAERPISVEDPLLTTPMALAVAPDGRTLYVAVNGDYDEGSGPNSLVAIRTATGTVSKTMTLNGGPIALAVAPGGRTVYVLNGNYGSFVTDTSTVTSVNVTTGRQGSQIRTGGLFSHASASDFAVTPDGRALYVAEGDVVVVRPSE